MKKAIIIAVILLVVGCAVAALTLAIYGWDNLNMDAEYTDQTYTFDRVNSLVVDVKSSNVTVCTTSEKTCKVVCHDSRFLKHYPKLEEGKLTIEETDERRWYDYIGFSIDSPAVTVYIPELKTDPTSSFFDPTKLFYAVEISVKSGDVSLEDLSVNESVSVSASSGNVSLENCHVWGDVTVDSKSGNVSVTKTLAEGDVSITTSSGEVSIDGCHFNADTTVETSSGDVSVTKTLADGDVSITTSSGEVETTIKSPKEYVVSTGSGDVSQTCKNEKGHGVCRITTSSGNVDIK
ncbi:MAG: DUF4097 domain-containing protein [Clostridia bacterium]|nr:DUF4097 domain-containing protein [Clostridia bacterium]